MFQYIALFNRAGVERWNFIAGVTFCVFLPHIWHGVNLFAYFSFQKYELY